MRDNLERKLEQENDSWLKSAFKEEWSTMGNSLASCGVAFGAAVGFSHYSKSFLESDVAISTVATILDGGGYWGTMIPQLIWKDKKKLRDENRKLSGKKIFKKSLEYFGCIGVLDGIYVLSRFGVQYYLQREGHDPTTAATITQLGATALYTLGFPPIRYALRQWSEK